MICIEKSKENIADNGQFMVGGGHEGRPVDCEMAKLRLWSLGSTDLWWGGDLGEDFRQLKHHYIEGKSFFFGGVFVEVCNDIELIYA